MKNFLLFVVTTFFIFLSADAQINKGSVLLGGGININTVKESTGRKQNSIAFTPAVGITIRQNLVAGIQLSYSHSENNIASPPEYYNNFYGAELFLRKYLPLGKGFYLFGQGGIYYRSDNYTNDFFPNQTKQVNNSVGIEFYPGISYAVTKRFHLEAGLANLVSMGYFKNKFTNAGVVTEDRSGVSINASTSSMSNFIIAFRFFLAKK